MGDHTSELTFGETGQQEFPFVQSKPAAIIGLMGRRGSGKDSIAKAAMKLDSSAVRLAFGDAVKHEVAEAIGHSHVWVEEHKEQLRPLIQAWGSEWRRTLSHPTNCITRLDQQLGMVDDDAIVFITDVRFQNEVDYIHSRGGVVVQIVRDTDGQALDPCDLHSSEMNTDDINPDARFLNNGPTPDSLNKGVEKLIEWALAPERVTPTPASEPLAN